MDQTDEVILRIAKVDGDPSFFEEEDVFGLPVAMSVEEAARVRAAFAEHAWAQDFLWGPWRDADRRNDEAMNRENLARFSGNQSGNTPG